MPLNLSQAMSLSGTNRPLVTNGFFNGILCTFQNCRPTNAITVDWGDGEVDILTILD